MLPAQVKLCEAHVVSRESIVASEGLPAGVGGGQSDLVE